MCKNHNRSFLLLSKGGIQWVSKYIQNSAPLGVLHSAGISTLVSHDFFLPLA